MELNTIALIAIHQCIDIKILDNAYVKIIILRKMEVNFVLNAIILGFLIYI